MRDFPEKSPRTAGKDEPTAIKLSLTLVWALASLIYAWSPLAPPESSIPARVVLLQPLWILRATKGDESWDQDLRLFLALHALWVLWTGGWPVPSLNRITDRTSPDGDSLHIYIETFFALAGCLLLAGLIALRGHYLRGATKQEHLAETRIEEHPLSHLLIPSRTTHSRLSPRKHTFSYSYLFVGIAVGNTGRFGSSLAVESNERAWFHIDGADFLPRGGASRGLLGKLKAYLHSQGVESCDWSFAYLVTAPRFMGYSFNPVSFWYLYDSEMKLRLMILEVNNTFGERRMYLLRCDGKESEASANSENHGEAGADETATLTFTETWSKDFHVSPFNSRKGSYSLRAIDPLAAFQAHGQVEIDNTIVLRSSKESTKIVARVYSDGSPSNPLTIGFVDLTRFVASWWWVGFLTLPRIVWEARKLYFKNKLDLYFRPEVTEASIGRRYTDDEKRLETSFRGFLTSVVEQAEKPVRVVYVPPHHDENEIALYSPGFTYEEDSRRTLTLKILSPAFYSRFVHYSHATEAFDRECLATDEKNRTASIEPASLLPVLLNAMQRPRKTSDKGRQHTLEGLRWSILTRLRCPPLAASYPSHAKNTSYSVEDIRSFGSSELDRFVLQAGVPDSAAYRRTVTKLFLAQRAALGLPIVVSAFDIAVRSLLLLVALIYVSDAKVHDIFRPSLQILDVISALVAILALANGVHIWNLAKG